MSSVGPICFWSAWQCGVAAWSIASRVSHRASCASGTKPAISKQKHRTKSEWQVEDHRRVGAVPVPDEGPTPPRTRVFFDDARTPLVCETWDQLHRFIQIAY